MASYRSNLRSVFVRMECFARVHRFVPSMPEPAISRGTVHVRRLLLAVCNPFAVGDLDADGGFALPLARVAQAGDDFCGNGRAAPGDLPRGSAVDVDWVVFEWSPRSPQGYNRLPKNDGSPAAVVVQWVEPKKGRPPPNPTFTAQHFL